jgi:hypothetical protein
MTDGKHNVHIVAAIIIAIGGIVATVIGVVLQNAQRNSLRATNSQPQREDGVQPVTPRSSTTAGLAAQVQQPSPRAPVYSATSAASAATRDVVQPDQSVTAQTAVLTDWPFRFTLAKCVHLPNNGPVQCTVLVENYSDQTQPFLPNPVYRTGARLSFLAGAEGAEYQATPTRGPDLAPSEVPSLSPHVQTSLYIAFEHVPESIRTATLVIQADHGAYGRQLSVAFRNIPIN